jgi:hypothetical protein
LNEIEEEEKLTSHTPLSSFNIKDAKQKSIKDHNEYKKSRNQNSTVYVGGLGNTIQSV